MQSRMDTTLHLLLPSTIRLRNRNRIAPRHSHTVSLHSDLQLTAEGGLHAEPTLFSTPPLPIFKWWCRASCPQTSADVLGTNCDQCQSMVQCCFTSTETVRLIRTESPGRPHQRSHGSWTLVSKSAESLLSLTHRVYYPACPPTCTQTLWNSPLVRLFPHHLEEEEEEEADEDMLAMEKHTQLLLLLS